jgi:hypothetical protein
LEGLIPFLSAVSFFVISSYSDLSFLFLFLFLFCRGKSTFSRKLVGDELKGDNGGFPKMIFAKCIASVALN